MRILITGASGFLGREVVKAAYAAGHNVVALLRRDSNPVLLEELPCDIETVVYDGSAESLKQAFREKTDAVFHLAAMIPVSHSPEIIPNLISANITYGTAVLEAATQAGCRYFVNSGSHWEYYQSDSYSPVNLYAATKHAFQKIMQWYEEAHGLCSVNLILFDTYGNHDPRPKLLSLLRKATISSAPIDMTPGEQLINLIHVKDAARGYLYALDLLLQNRIASGSSYALHGKRAINIKKLVELYERLLDVRCSIRWGGIDYRDREVLIPWAGESLPDFVCTISLEEGISALKGELYE